MTKGLGVLAVLLLTCVVAGQARAFCVHNMSDAKVKVWHTDFPGDFSVKLESTEQACCNWQNKDCNPSGEATARVGFNVKVLVPGGAAFNDYEICNFPVIPANGDLYIYKKNNSYVCGDTLPPLPPFPVQ